MSPLWIHFRTVKGMVPGPLRSSQLFGFYVLRSSEAFLRADIAVGYEQLFLQVFLDLIILFITFHKIDVITQHFLYYSKILVQHEIHIVSQCNYKIAQEVSKNLVLYTDSRNLHVSRGRQKSIIKKERDQFLPFYNHGMGASLLEEESISQHSNDVLALFNEQEEIFKLKS